LIENFLQKSILRNKAPDNELIHVTYNILKF
jgi:hypothetical protein